jgi:GDP-mannose 4,6-dehydratase
MKALITGITGFVGSHMAEHLLKKKVEVYGTYRWRSRTENIEDFKDKLMLVDCELLDPTAVKECIKEVEPDVIYHLAAQSYVLSSFKQPAVTIQVNVLGTLNILESVRQLKLNPIIHICSSSEVYGQVRKDEIPIVETNPLRPASPYGVSKVGEDMLGLQYYLSYGLRTIRTRMFTHTGPRRGPVFAESSFAKQIAEIEKGKRDPVIQVGNLKSVRTFADVRDTVRAYCLLTEKCPAGEVYNIGGNRTVTVGEMLDYLISQARPNVRKIIKIKVEPSRLRPSDVTLQIPSIEKFRKATGWEPEIPFEQTMKDLLNYWRSKV